MWVLFSDVRVVWLCDLFGLCVRGGSAHCHLDWIGDTSRRHDLLQRGADRRMRRRTSGVVFRMCVLFGCVHVSIVRVGRSFLCHLDWIGDMSRRHDLPQSGAVRRR